MANTYSSLNYHLVFSTKNREPWLREEGRTRLWSYLGGIARENGMTARQIGGVADHVHLLITIPPRLSVSKAVQLLKGGSSHWLKATFPKLAAFAWQDGYAVFTVSESQIKADTLQGRKSITAQKHSPGNIGPFSSGTESNSMNAISLDDFKRRSATHSHCIRNTRAQARAYFHLPRTRLSQRSPTNTQTSRILERCLLMTTDPGDLVLDPTGKIPGKATFQCKTVPHIALKSIARNTSLDPIFAKHEPILAAALEKLNKEVSRGDAEARRTLREKLVEKLKAKCREQKASSLTDADRRRCILPGTSPLLFQPAKGVLTAKKASDLRDFASSRETEWKEWQVPFDTDPDWPQPVADALTAYRAAWRAKMDEANACIAANAEMKELVDKPETVSNTLFPTDKERIAAWFLDTDYDGRTFCICQAFFPNKSKWAKLVKALGDANVMDANAFEALSGLKSLPFPRPARLAPGEPWGVAVRVIDPRRNEGLRVLPVKD